MKFAYFDCFAGISGDMILGALVDLGLELADLEKGLAALNLPGFKLRAAKVKRAGIAGTKVDVLVEEGPHPHRHLQDIEQIVSNSNLKDNVKETSLQIFRKLAAAEAKIHATDPGRIHFHEVGALDSVADIVGAAVGLDLLDIGEVYSSRLNVGSGFLQCEHGVLPVPAPATLELLRGVPIYAYGPERELLTPTGAAFISTLSRGYGPLPALVVENVGYGAGGRDLEIPNLLRVLVGTRLIQGGETKERFHEHAASC